MRSANKSYPKLFWSKIKEKAHKDLLRRNHSKIILLQIAEEMPDFTSPAIMEIEKLGLKLDYEQISHLLDLRHIQFDTQLAKKLRRLRKEQLEKIEKIHSLIEQIKKTDQKLRELRRK